MTVERLEVLKESEKSKVYLVFDTENRRMLVEKHLQGERRIYETLQTIQHPYLPKVYDVRFEDGETVVTEEYITGGSLGQMKTDEAQISKWLLELCQVLAVLHGHHILHRDIKPSNLLLGEDGHIRLIDFDAARQSNEDAETDTQLLGTRGYAPPEQYGFAQTDQRADIYALGITFRGLLGAAGKKRRWRRILSRCTALEPKRRYARVRCIPLAIYLGRFWRRICRPICCLLLALAVSFAAFLVISPDSRLALASIFGMADTKPWTDSAIDIAALRSAIADGTAPLLYEYSGDEVAARYQVLKEKYPEVHFIYSGFMDPQGELVFGGVYATYYLLNGVYGTDEFWGIVRVDASGSIHEIPTTEHGAYAPAVTAIYENLINYHGNK